MPLRLPQEDWPLLVTLFRLPKASIKALIKSIRREPPALKLQTLAARISQRTNIESRAVSQILVVITKLFSAAKQSGLNVEDFLNEFRKTLEETELPELRFENKQWNEYNRYLVQILQSASIGVTSKALSVMTDHARVFRDARILTDLRPVFGQDPRQRLQAGVIVHTLKIDHRADHEEKEFFVALDSVDLDRLESLVRRAKLKEKALKKSSKISGLSILEPQ